MQLTNPQAWSIIALLAAASTTLACPIPTEASCKRGSYTNGKVSRSIFHMNTSRCLGSSTRVRRRAEADMSVKHVGVGKLLELIGEMMGGGEKEGGGETEKEPVEGGEKEGGGESEKKPVEGGEKEGGGAETGPGEGGEQGGGEQEGGGAEKGPVEGGQGGGGGTETENPTEGGAGNVESPVEGTLPAEGEEEEKTPNSGEGGAEQPPSRENPEATPVVESPTSRFPIFTPTPSPSPRQ